MVSVVGRQEVSPDSVRLRFAAPEAASAAQPGQFLHLRCGTSLDPLLRRPFSVHAVDPVVGTVSILFRVVGVGTAWLARRHPGDVVDLWGPLGRGFVLHPGDGWLVAGGVGVAPLLFLAARLREQGAAPRLLWGARRRQELAAVAEFEHLGVPVELATDDGSEGHHGPVTDLLAEVLSGRRAPVYACGPRPMLRRVGELTRQAAVTAQVSLEERMACGVGACQGCACPRRGGGYALVCHDGPVFPAEEVELG